LVFIQSRWVARQQWRAIAIPAANNLPMPGVAFLDSQ
jgi:hypothetical protein